MTDEQMRERVKALWPADLPQPIVIGGNIYPNGNWTGYNESAQQRCDDNLNRVREAIRNTPASPGESAEKKS